MFKKIKNFYIENMDLVNKFLLNQIVMSILGIMVCLPMAMFGDAAMILASVFASVFFACLLYDNAWDKGFKDSNRVSNNRLKYRPFHGAKVALFAYAPSLLFLLLWSVDAILRICEIYAFETIGTIAKTIVLFFCNGTYLGIVNVLVNYIDLAYLVLIAMGCFLPAICAYCLGYRLGLADKQIKTLFGMKPALGEGAKQPDKSKKKH